LTMGMILSIPIASAGVLLIWTSQRKKPTSRALWSSTICPYPIWSTYKSWRKVPCLCPLTWAWHWRTQNLATTKRQIHWVAKVISRLLQKSVRCLVRWSAFGWRKRGSNLVAQQSLASSNLGRVAALWWRTVFVCLAKCPVFWTRQE